MRTPMETRGGNAEVPEFPQKTGETSPSYHLKRLLAVNDTNYSRDFKYDEFGNMAVSAYAGIAAVGLTPQIGGSRPNPYDPGTNRLLSAGYDTRGDMTALGTTTMTYDAEGRQVSTTDSGVGGQSISYAFDAEGQRVAKQVAGGATVIDVHDAFGRLAVEYSSASLTAACNTCYLAYDGLGSVRLITNENGGVVARHDYLPYGEEIPDGTAGRSGNFGYSSNVRQGFTGQELDGATATMSSGTAELEYFNARHLSAVLGSFTQPDPMQAGADFLNPQSWNGYAYVLGNPLAMVDPSGMTQQNAGGLDGYNCYSAEYAYPCYGIPGVGWGGWGGGGGSPPGGGGGGGAPSSGGGMTGSLPPDSFPGGENLGLPPGVALPGSLGIGLPDPFVFSACSATDPQCVDPRFWNVYLSATRGASWLAAFRLLGDFFSGGGSTIRTYYTNSSQSQDLMNSRGFNSALRRACASHVSSGRFDVGTFEAAGNLEHDANYSPTGVQVGGFLGTYTLEGSSMHVSINNEAGAHSFFEHAIPNSPFSSGPFRTITQRFELDLRVPCGSSW